MVLDMEANMKAQVYHDIRANDRIFLCIARNGSPEEMAKIQYSVERELLPEQATPAGIQALIAEISSESGLALEPSDILKSELGL